ncbi:hypothetical protein [Bacillus safensis]|uniref:hypothetical protein n=1 Tax=Bacillus safensis TaxID=561879 RepID=UPI0005977FDF|nr:hypothetical protein [Bacillus safensis]KIL19051.1 hypothetical protein B4107_1111 [Bacillus safensis]
MKLKKLVLSTTATSALLFTTLGFGNIVLAEEKVSTKDHILHFILEKNPGLKKEELIKDINNIVINEKKSEMEILEQIQSELKSQEENINKGEVTTLGNNKGTKIIGNSKKGNIYYTNADTWGLNHGHVGMYYKKTHIVESVPKLGVRSISAKKRKVEKGAVVKSVKVATKKKNAAVNWGKGRIKKDGYSYNFATNRTTGHYGSKNCSKLIWSAFKLKAKIDIDKNGGLGVYPRDVRDSGYTKLVRKVK